jgi:nucleoside-specific outer membrane channel protein Tsx
MGVSFIDFISPNYWKQSILAIKTTAVVQPTRQVTRYLEKLGFIDFSKVPFIYIFFDFFYFMTSNDEKEKHAVEKE